MALIACGECGKEISDKAAACPHCGAPLAAPTATPMLVLEPPPKSSVWGWVLGIAGVLVVAFFGLGFAASNSPDGQEKQRARDVIALCWSDYERKSASPSTKTVIAAQCERFENDFESRWRHKP
ncbi:MAG: zinc ribbon domain-containing protein [Pseudomonadota bacterium]